MAATIPNPATVASAHKKLTLDVLLLFYAAWTESKSIHPVPKSHLLSLKASRLFRTRNPKRPAPDSSTGELIQVFKAAKTASSHANRNARPAIYAARNNNHTHSSPHYTSHIPHDQFKAGRTQWSQPSISKLTTRHNHLDKHIGALAKLRYLTTLPPPYENM